IHSPAVTRVLEAVQAAGTTRPAPPRAFDWWEPAARALAERLQVEPPPSWDGQHWGEVSELNALVDKLEGKLQEFDAALAKEPRTVDRVRAEYLEMLARYAQQLILRLVEVLRGSTLADNPCGGVAVVHQRLLEVATALLAKAEERARRTWDQRFAWAAA